MILLKDFTCEYYTRKSVDDLPPYFEYELTTMPTSLFSDCGLRKTNKSTLAKELRKTLEGAVQFQMPAGQLHHVIDGGCLLHRVVWLTTGTYIDIVQQYMNYVRKHYGYRCSVVFDGYCGGPSVKDAEHQRRAKKECPDIDVEQHNPVYGNQAAFLMNANNKQAFVNLLAQHLQAQNYTVYHAKDDADTLIARVTMDLAGKRDSTIVVVTDDTDVLVLLLYHFREEMSDIIMMSEMARKRTARKALSPIREIRNNVGQRAVNQLLVIHAISGCDSTSAMYGHGKVGVFKNITKHRDSEILTSIIESGSSSHAQVVEAGLRLMTLLYGGKPESDTLNSLRYEGYMSQLSSCKNQPRPERLPPTEDAAKYHIMRVHIQVVQWKYLMDIELDAKEWGWKDVNGVLQPIATELRAAPDDLLNIISCKCKMMRSHPCSSMICTCYKHGLSCVTACKHCCGKACNNVLINSSTSYPESLEDSEAEELRIDGLHDEADIEIYEEIVETEMD